MLTKRLKVPSTGTRISVRHGSEGPKHDPYSYDEVTVARPDSVVTIHSGLALWVEIDGLRIDYNSPDKTLPTDKDLARAAFNLFAKQSGVPFDVAIRAHEESRMRCTCGGRATETAPGYPGETLYLCGKCGTIVTSEVDWSSIE